MATVIPSKGGSGKFMTDRVMKFFEECGDQAGDIIIKTEQEAAIACLVRSIVTERGNEIGRRKESPVGIHASYVIVKRAVQTVEGQVRVMKIALQARLGIPVNAGANIVTFMAEYASFLLNRLELGKDGKTADESMENPRQCWASSLEKKCSGRKMRSPRWTRSARDRST